MARPVTLRKLGDARVITVPKEFRDKLLWRVGDVLQIDLQGNALLVRRMLPPEPVRVVRDGQLSEGGR